MTKLCPECTAENEEAATTCVSCGAKLGPGGQTTISFPGAPDQGEAAVPTVEPGEKPQLVVVKGPNPGSSFVLAAGQISIGRDPGSDIFLNDVTVSRKHAQITVDDRGIRIRDVGSLNGTYLNGRRVDASRLEGGDELQIGKYRLLFVIGG